MAPAYSDVCLTLSLLGLLTVMAVTDWMSTATSPKLLPKIPAVLPLVRADPYRDALVLFPLKNATVLATLTEPAELLSMVTCTGLPVRISMLVVS